MTLLLVVLAGCGLPLPDGVRSAGDVPAAQPEAAPLQFLPAPPRKGATATELVSGFLAAQSSPDNDYAIAKQFLLPGAKWDISARTTLYRAGSNRAELLTEGGNRVLVSYQPAGYIDTDGAFSLPPLGAERSTDPAYGFVREPVSGELRLASVPAGVRLADIDRAGSYVARNVYFFARTDAPAASDRLVADRVFQLTTVAPERALVEALLAGPSTGLAPPSESPQPRGAVESLVPPGTALRSLRVDEGVVTVDLSAEVEALSPQDRRRLSAQFVWTLLPTFRGVRLLVEGQPLEVPGVGAVQDRDDWARFDPESLGGDVPLLYVADRRLRRLDGSLSSSPVTRNGELDVDLGALAPVSRELAVLTKASAKGDVDVVHTGPLGGPFARVFSRPALASLSWGSGDRGLYLLQQGLRPIVWLLPDVDARPEGTERAVAYDPRAGAGPLSALAVSRDGARIALVFGEGLNRQLYVGRIEPTPKGPPAIRRIVPVALGLSNVADVAWESGTSLVVLASNDDRLSDDGRPKVLLFRVAVDGSSSDSPLNSTNLPNSGADSVAAAPGQPLVVGVETATKRRELHEDTGAQFVQKLQNGSTPFYPG